MRILFIVDQFPKLSETFILNQITGLKKRGFHVTILAKSKEENKIVHQDIINNNLLEKTIYWNPRVVNRKISQILLLLKMLPSFLVEIFSSKINCISILLMCLKNPKLVLIIDLLLKKKQTKFDIIAAHFGNNGILADNLINLGILQGKLYVTFHGYDMTGFLNNKKNIKLYHKFLNGNHILLPISKYWKNKLITLGAKKENIVVHHMGIDIAKFPIEANTIVNNEINIVSVARLVEKKGLQYGVSAVSSLIKKGYRIRYNIIGDGVLKEKLKTQIIKEGMDCSIKLLGWREQSDVVEFVKESNIVLLPSVKSNNGGDMEGIPVFLMEAMAMGKVVVSTLHSGIPELVENNYNGYLVPERDVVMLEKALRSAIFHKEQWNSIGEKAHAKIIQDFNIDKLNNGLIELFHRFE